MKICLQWSDNVLNFIIKGYIFNMLVVIWKIPLLVLFLTIWNIWRVEQWNINLSIIAYFYFAHRWILIKFDLLTGGQNRCYLNGGEKHMEPQGHLQTSVTQYWFIVYWSMKENTSLQKCTKLHSELLQLGHHNIISSLR